MAVPEQTPFIEFTANGTTTVFQLPFQCDNADYLIVNLDGNEAPVGSWNFVNDILTFNTAPANGVIVSIERNTPFQRTTEYQSYNNSFRPSPVNKDFDLIWWKLQELGYRDQVIWLALVKEIADRIAGDNNLQNQINTIDEWLDNLQQNVNENTSDIAQLVTDLSKEIADRIANDEALKEMFLAMMDEAINEGTINALAITHVDSLEALEAIVNVWDGRTVYVKDLGHYEYDSDTTTWVKVYQDADNVKDGLETQKQINDKNIRSFESIADLLTYTPRKNGQIVYVKSTFSNYVYDTTKSLINNEITIINGWVLQQNIPSVVDVYQAGFLLNGSDEAAKVQAVLSLNLKLKIPAGTIVYSSTFDQTKIFGEGTFYFLGNVSTTQWSYSPSRALRHDVPTEKPEQKIIETTANWESASALSLLVNQASIDRAQLSGVQSKSQHLGLRFTDTTGIYIGVLAKRHSVFTNCTYTSNSVTSNDIVAGLNISAGEFLGVVTDATTWHLGLVDYVDFPNKKIFVKAWWNTLTKVEETPTVSTCYGPYTNAIWGQNTNVYLQDDRPAHSAIGYELGVRDRRVQGFTSRADGYLAVNLDGTTQKTLGSAFITSGLWRFALNAINIERAAVNMEITASTQTGLRVNQSTASNFVGKIIEATRGDTAEVSYYIDAYGRLSRSAQEYRVISGTTTHNALQFSLVLGANATGAHTTTINTVGMRPGHILEFKQLQSLDWTILAGSTTFVLNNSGTIDYLKLLYDGTTFIKILAAKSS